MKAKLLSAAAAALMIGLSLLTLPLVLPRLLGFQVYSVLTPSMVPALPVGSAIYAKSCNPEELAEGAIITFSLGSATELVEVHRVVQNDTQKREIITKGDANAQPDVTPVSYGRVTGEVLFSIPLLGAVSTALHSVGGIAVCIAIFALACLLWAFADKIKKRERFK
ncbi:signal peptidase I [Bittarella massiliensis (ex Durand et al. 2017)]|uniref:signal peptidase I n=1 Tax=Bittarella massiliensis (ex Durand et al. 2017) TaxID=1720313 RepID=UPI001A9A303F|nr:signal peptidase I [Bittarella massiliensis (ex Durand et al. 2017)]